MSVLPARLRVETCPHCKSAVGPSELVCGSCTGILPIERGLHWLAFRVAAERERVGRFLRDQGLVIWLLALTPLLFVPPIFALIVVFTAREAKGARRDRTFVSAVAVVNIVVSFLAWHGLAEFMFGLWFAIWRLIVFYGTHHGWIKRLTSV